MVRLAGLGDLDAVSRIVRDAYRHYVARIGREPGPMLDDYESRIAAGQVWVWESGGPGDGIVRGLVVLEDAEGALLLDNIAVDPATQGSGIGRALLSFVEDEARRRGHGAVRLYTNALMTENLALYARLGFVETERVTEKGFDRVYMSKRA